MRQGHPQNNKARNTRSMTKGRSVSPSGLTSTRAGLASELYAEAAKLSPNDSRVKNAATQIADAFLKLATVRADEKKLSRGR